MMFCCTRRRSTVLYIIAAFNATLAVLTCIVNQRVSVTSSLIALCALVEYGWARAIDRMMQQKIVFHMPEPPMEF